MTADKSFRYKELIKTKLGDWLRLDLAGRERRG